MGSSGSGKTTLLNALAHRQAAANAQISGTITVNGQTVPLGIFRRISSYVEQDDALIGSLTARETINFTARLALERYRPHWSLFTEMVHLTWCITARSNVRNARLASTTCSRLLDSSTRGMRSLVHRFAKASAEVRSVA